MLLKEEKERVTKLEVCVRACVRALFESMSE